MATGHPIPPFPADIDRDAFGHWLSGFCDGEGCFFLGLDLRSRHASNAPTPKAAFFLVLRADDMAVLRQIHSFWQCGRVRLRRTYGRPGHPAFDLTCDGWAEMAGVLVPHFDRYPLRAKKARDFAVWREAVLLGARRAMPCLDRRRHWRSRSVWTPPDRERFVALHDLLRQQRQFATHESPPSSPPVGRPEQRHFGF
jgi:hypothetical protein